MEIRTTPVLLAAGVLLGSALPAPAQNRAPAGKKPPAQKTPAQKAPPPKPAPEKPAPAKVQSVTERLFAAIEKGDAVGVRALLLAGADPNARNEDGDGALSVAAAAGSLPICEALVERGARVRPEKEESSPLLTAIVVGSELVVRLLLKHGADPNEARDGIPTPVQAAASANQTALLELLISQGGKADAEAVFMAADAGATGTALALLRRGIDANFRGKEGKTPLMAAAAHGALPMIEALLKGGAEVNAKDEVGKTAMMYATGATRAQVVARLKQAGAREFAPTLMEAVRQADTRAIRALLASGADANERDAQGRTPLFFAVQSADDSVAKSLLEKGADPNARDKTGGTPVKAATEWGNHSALQLLVEAGAEAHDFELHEAIQANDLEAIQQALVDGADPNGINEHGEPALAAAFNVLGGEPNPEIIHLLLARGAKVNSTDREGQTLLFHAVLAGKLSFVKEFLDRGADPNLTDSLGKTALMSVTGDEADGIALLLIERGADVRAKAKNGETVLLRLAGEVGPEVLKLVLDRVDAAEINHRPNLESSALYHAAAEGRAGNVKLLLERGADPNLGDGSAHSTPLTAVANAEFKEGREYLETARLLLQHGANPNVVDETGGTPLQAALQAGQDDLAELLRKAGAKLPAPPKPSSQLIKAAQEGDLFTARMLLRQGQNPNVVDESGYSALTWACIRGNAEIVRLLLARGAKPNPKLSNPNGFEAPPPLYEAAEVVSVPIIRMLLKSGANINAMWADSTPLEEAVKAGHYEACTALLAAGAKVDAHQGGGADVLGRAMLHTDTHILKLLLQHGAKPNGRVGQSAPLIIAAQAGNVAAVRVLLAAGADAKAVDDSGQTALIAAAGSGSLELVQLLLTKGVDINARDERNHTALSVAEDAGREEVVDLLKRAGAKP